ncbi:WYL domain-containing protein [Pseudomonas luteola]|uniref:helix-turn-helix transcriptional regulator n=1 Tax=Pseudomonas luteola TaxID=47886 RepID=UPI000F7B9F44|nr:WYL domain-containing protein [Pseudomonas luteola]RRW39685.1 WYL domain-containing protein [Pseudomonas luteola]
MAPQKHDALALRLAEIIRLLYSGERPTRLQLADRFAVNERTIYRDLNRLGEIIESRPDGTYQLASHHRSSLSSTDLRTFAKISGVQQLFPMGDRRSWLDILDSRNTSFLVRDAHFEASNPDSLLFSKLSQAVEQRRRCQLSYTSKVRLIEPYRLVHNEGIWYLATTESNRLKSFALGRIHELRVLDKSLRLIPMSTCRLKTMKTSGSVKPGSRSK